VPLGGMAVLIVLGNFFQITPVSGFPLYIPDRARPGYAPTPADKPKLKARHKNAGRADIKGANLFRLFEKYELTEQMRAARRTLSTPTFSNACMRAAARQPFNDQEVIERLKSRTLTAEDVPTLTLSSRPIMVVTTNAERHRVNLFARKAFCQTPRRVRHPVPEEI
jgi:hypothetical protein